jgi:hypothetical protein
MLPYTFCGLSSLSYLSLDTNSVTFDSTAYLNSAKVQCPVHTCSWVQDSSISTSYSLQISNLYVGAEIYEECLWNSGLPYDAIKISTPNVVYFPYPIIFFPESFFSSSIFYRLREITMKYFEFNIPITLFSSPFINKM